MHRKIWFCEVCSRQYDVTNGARVAYLRDMNPSKHENHRPQKINFKSVGKTDPTYEFTSNQGYYRDEEDTLQVKTDHEIQEVVMTALKGCGKLDSSQIQCSVNEGEVELTGTVPVVEMKLYAEEAIEDLPEVKKIINFISISVPPNFDHVGAFLSSEKTM